MSKKIIGDMAVSVNTTSFSKNTIRDINGVNADNTGKIDLPHYSKAEVDKIIRSLPISRVGSMDYLPLSINGSFEGATTDFVSKHILPCILEDDGTFVYLRPGTNGSTQGYYYGYVPNARTSDSLTPVLTNETYVPSFFTANHKLINMVGTKASELLFMYTQNNTTDTYTIALTNGSLNQTQHQYCEFNRSLLGIMIPQYAHIVGDRIYIWGITSTVQAGEFSVQLYTVLTSDIRAGSTASLTLISGITGNTIYGDASNNNRIMIAPMNVSASTTNKPFIQLDSTTQANMYPQNSDGLIQAAANSTNTSIRVAIFHALSAQTALVGVNQSTWGLSFTYNISTKQYVLDKPNAGPITVLANPDIVVTNPYYVPMNRINGFPETAQGNVPTMYHTSDGTVFSTVARYITAPDHKIVRANISGFTNAYDALNLTTRSLSGQLIKYVSPVYGSAVGENLLGATMLSPSRILLNCSGTDADGDYFGFDQKVVADIGTSRTYTYNSVANGNTITGFAPQVNRQAIDNPNYAYNGLVSLVNTDGTVSVFGTSFFEGIGKPEQNGLLDVNTMQFSEDIVKLQSSNLLTSLKNTILSSVTYSGTIQSSTIILYYVPDSSYCKSIAVTSFKTDSNNTAYCVVSEVNTTLAVDVIGTVVQTTITAMSPTSNRISTVMNNNIDVLYGYLYRQAGLVVAKYSGFNYIGIPAIVNFYTVTNANFRSFLGKVDSSSGLITGNLTMIASNYVSGPGGDNYEVGVIPNVGFGVYRYNANITDYSTKLIFKNFGTTSAQMDAMLSNVGGTPVETIVIASQDVAQGFIVYFTQPVPALLYGKYYELPVQSIDLTTIVANPANRTFYMYIEVDGNGDAKYTISTTLLSEELNRVYIGSIVTGATHITTIDSEKVTRFLTYRTSITKRGSAIPASSGNPSSTGTRWH